MPRHAHTHQVAATATVIDPVCGMTIFPDDSVGHLEHDGQTYYFCSQRCLDEFRANPEPFLAGRSDAPVTAADMEREYICPMRSAPMPVLYRLA